MNSDIREKLRELVAHWRSSANYLPGPVRAMCAEQLESLLAAEPEERTFNRFMLRAAFQAARMIYCNDNGEIVQRMDIPGNAVFDLFDDWLAKRGGEK